MRKIFVLAAVVLSAGFVSCGGNTASNAEGVDSLGIDSVATLVEPTVENVLKELTDKVQSGDLDAVNDFVKQTKENIESAIESGDEVTLQKYADEIRGFVEESAQKLEELDDTTLVNLLNVIKDISSAVEESANEAVDKAKSDADSLKNEAVQSATSHAEKAVEDVKAKANAKVDSVAAKATEKVGEALKKAAGKLQLN